MTKRHLYTLVADLSHTLHMFHPFRQTNHLQTLDTTYATKYLPRSHSLEDLSNST
jgi:hypothetical protein